MVIDSSGQSLERLLNGRPDLLKPNESEMHSLMGRSGSLAERIAFAVEHLIRRRMASDARVVLSLGPAGAILVSASRVLQALAPNVDVVNTVGCGDALLAGYVHGRLSGLDEVASLREATAFGTAAALQEVAGVVAMRDVDRLRSEVRVSDVPPSRETRQTHQRSST
jgi:tagatose 6-phosphate kinase